MIGNLIAFTLSLDDFVITLTLTAAAMILQGCGARWRGPE
jgi:ABC-type spermidine/putrescine transport system permease subunit II